MAEEKEDEAEEERDRRRRRISWGESADRRSICPGFTSTLLPADYTAQRPPAVQPLQMSFVPLSD